MFWTCSGFHPILTYIPFKMQMFLTFWKPYVMFLFNSQLCSFNYLSCGDVIYGISYLCSFSCLSYGDVIYGIAEVCLIPYTIVGTTNGSTLPFIILCALKFVLSCSPFIPKLEAPPFATLFFLLRALFWRSIVIFFCFLMLSTYPP
jgi:hypothetical protein